MQIFNRFLCVISLAAFTRRTMAVPALAALLLMGAGASLAQTGGTGSIQGTITDPTGSLVVGAKVTATNTLTNVVTQAVTTDAGHYTLPLLQPGPYDVTVTSPNFAPVTQKNVIVDALSSIAVNAKLSTTVTTESVTVTGEQAALQTNDLKLGSNIDNDTYNALPLAMNQSARDPSAFIGMAVGVNSFSVAAAGPTTASFNGGQTYQNETYIEGLAMTSAGTESDTRNLAFGISVEAVEQFQVAVTGSEATYEGQGVSNFIIKSGTGKFHGGVNEYFRNTIFDAKNFFTANRTVEHQNEFGGSLGGPLLRNKLFFFANYDGYRFAATTLPTLQNIPTVKERTGDFSEYPQKIYDPTTCLTTTAGGVCTGRQQFSYNGVLNVIPPSRLSKVSQSLQSYLPAPTIAGITQNYLAILPNQVINDSGTLKVDYNLSSKHRAYGIFTRGKYANPLVGSLSGQSATANSALPVPYTDGRGVIEYATVAQLHEAWVIKPSLVNDFGYGLSRLYIPLTSNTAAGNYPSKAGLTGLPAGIAATGFPDVTFGGNNNRVPWDGTNSHAFNEWQTTFTAQDNILWTMGKHQMTFGYQWQALQDNENTPLTGTQAGFTFSNAETANFVGGTGSGATGIDNTTGLGYASYLLGAVDNSTVTQNAVIETGGRYKTNAAYVQDNIQFTPNLTVNLGLRWDVWTPFTEVLDRMTFFNPNIANPVAGGILGGLQFAGHGADSCGCRTPVKTHYKYFGPRIGIAYKINNSTVIRAAYDIFYSHAGGVGGRTNGRQGLSQIGFNSNGSLASSVTGQPAYAWDSGVPGNPINPPFFNPSYGIGFIEPTAPGAAAIGAGRTTAQTLVYGDPDKGAQPPQYQNFFLNIQHSFGNAMTLSVAYSGSLGRYLPGASVFGPFTNQIPLKYLPLGSVLTETLNAAGIADAAKLGFTVAAPFPNFSTTATVGQALKPYPQYNGLSDPWLDVGKSSYNSLQTTMNRRVSNGLTFQVNYTFSKEMDDLAAARLPGSNYLEYTVGGLYRKHVLQSNAVYKLPFGPGRRFNPSNAVVRSVVRDWQITGIFLETSGAPLAITGTCQGYGVIDSTCYPNLTTGYTGNIHPNPLPTTAFAATNADATKGPVLRTIDLAAFTNPLAGAYGNAARSAPYGLFAPHVANIDGSVRKEIPLYWESVRLVIQADVFNLPNRVYFAAPGTGTGGSNFGQFGSTANQPRKFQFVGRISF